MFRGIKHAVRQSGFVHKHPIITFGLMAVGLGAIVEGAIHWTGKKPSTSQPIQSTAGGGAA